MRPLLGITLKILSALAFTLMSAAIRQMSSVYPTGELVFFRSAFALVPLIVWLAARRELPSAVRTANVTGHFKRGLIGGCGMFCGFLALTYLPLSEAVAIGLVAEARVAERIGVAKSGTARVIEGVCRAAGLPTEVPAVPVDTLIGFTRTDKKARAEKLEQLLAEFHIERLRDSPAMALSGGERRRCEIARALAANPSIMLLDEPFAGIDPISIQDIRDLIKDLKNRDIGVLITDHNVRETLDIVDRACIIYGGQVLFAGSPQDLVADENVRRLYLGESFEL